MAAKRKTRSTNKKAGATSTARRRAPVRQQKVEKKIDIVEEAKRELEKIEKTQATPTYQANKTFPWGVLLGGFLLGIAAVLLVTYVNRHYIIPQKLTASLPEIITPLGGGMTLDTVGKPKYTDDVYEFTIKFADIDEEFTSSITGDAKTFFVEGISVDELLGAATEDGTATEVSAATCDSVNKSAAPELATYIVADCPYGKQMQTVMLSAIEQAPELADYFKVRYFFDSISDDGKVTSMHGDAEAQESLRQICIREEQPDLFWNYIDCYANDGTTDTCLTQAQVNVTTVNSCMTSATRGIAWAKEDDALAQKHSVSGSPTLVLNDTETISESNFGGRNAESLKSAVCCSADNALSFCDLAITQEVAAANGNC